MSEPEHFLQRWSRRKLAPDEHNKAAPPEPAERAPVPAGEPNEKAGPPQPASSCDKDESVFDWTKLPPIESIEAGTDITGYLKAGVPPELTRAALRRVWVADPSIRDFVGLSENSWDFNAGKVPGFGSISPQEVARLFERLEKFASSEPTEKEPTSATEKAKSEPVPEQVASDARSVPERSDTQPNSQPAEDPKAAPVRRHGRALPT